MGILDNLKGVIGDEGMNLIETASKGAISGAGKAAINAVNPIELAPPTTQPVDLAPPVIENPTTSEKATISKKSSEGSQDQDNISKLFRLQEMLESGLITDSEFQILKKQLFS